MKKQIIINADDCGLNTVVNQAIENCIIQERLTSTTVMATGYDIEGAKKLFNDYKNIISFGGHITLDDGKALLFNQCMADNGFIMLENGEWHFTRELWKRKLITGSLKEAIIKECCTQVEFLLDNGFELSHFDSHHHVHTSMGMYWLLPLICKKYKVNKYRRMRNNFPLSMNYVARLVWNRVEKLQCTHLKTTDVFCPCSHIFNNENVFAIRNARTIELMCHPGHPHDRYQEEITNLLGRDKILLHSEYELINYNQL